jgi:hypothetical protein
VSVERQSSFDGLLRQDELFSASSHPTDVQLYSALLNARLREARKEIGSFRARAEDRLALAQDALDRYSMHDAECEAWFHVVPCNCGLAALRRELDEEGTP